MEEVNFEQLVCEKHQTGMIVVNSYDFTQFCPLCADELFETERPRMAETFERVISRLSPEALSRLNEFLSAMVAKNNSRSLPECLLIAVVSRALRDDCAVAEVVGKIIAARSADYLFHHF